MWLIFPLLGTPRTKDTLFVALQDDAGAVCCRTNVNHTERIKRSRKFACKGQGGAVPTISTLQSATIDSADSADSCPDALHGSQRQHDSGRSWANSSSHSVEPSPSPEQGCVLNVERWRLPSVSLYSMVEAHAPRASSGRVLAALTRRASVGMILRFLFRANNQNIR